MIPSVVKRGWAASLAEQHNEQVLGNRCPKFESPKPPRPFLPSLHWLTTHPESPIRTKAPKRDSTDSWIQATTSCTDRLSKSRDSQTEQHNEQVLGDRRPVVETPGCPGLSRLFLRLGQKLLLDQVDGHPDDLGQREPIAHKAAERNVGDEEGGLLGDGGAQQVDDAGRGLGHLHEVEGFEGFENNC
jgi:hypothetical protein